MDNIYKAVQLTIDSQNLALSKTPTHVYIANQYVDTNDTPLITAPFIIQKALENGTGVVDIVSSTIGSIYEVRLLCDAEVLISGYFYMPPMNVNFSELELYTSYPPRTPPVINEFWQQTEQYILEKTNTLLNFVQVFNSVASIRLLVGNLEDLLVVNNRSSLVGAVNQLKLIIDEISKNIGDKAKLSTEQKETIVGAINEIKTLLTTHAEDYNNPHQVTKAQVGLGNVDNVADIDKPVSNATKSAITTATNDMATKDYVNQKDNLKADKATTLRGYGITDAYTKAEADNKINTLSNTTYAGHKGYATLAAAQAAQASLPANTLVEVTSDTTTANNGVYLWNGTTLTKSAYDPLVQSKNYTDEAVAILPIEQISSDDYSFIIRDRNGIAAVGVLLDKDGKPSIYMLNSIFDGIVNRIAEKVTSEIELAGVSYRKSPDGSFFIVDKNDRLSWLGMNSQGKPISYTIKCIVEALDQYGYSLTPSSVKSTYQTSTKKAISGPDIVCWGDSMTAGAGGNGTTYPNVLKTLMQNAGSTANVNNMGVGGETSVTICARQGGNPFLINVTGGIIPADTSPVTVTLEQIDGQTVRPLLQGAGSFTGLLDGIPGTLNLVEPSGSSSSWQADNYYTFARTTAGTQITIDRPKPFYLDVAAPRLGDIHIIWIGQNGPSTARAISDTKAMIQRMQALGKRYLVISKPTSTDTDDSLFFAEFGRRFIAARKYLVQYGLQDAGITPTAQDNTDIANGIVPTSLRADAVHWTAQGYTILANLLFNRIKELGWI